MATKNTNEAATDLDSPPFSGPQNLAQILSSIHPLRKKNGFVRDVNDKLKSKASQLKQPQTISDKVAEAWAEGDEFDLLSLEHKAAEEFYKLPKFGKIYEAVTVDVESIGKHLKDLSLMNVRMFEPLNTPREMIFIGHQIADSVSLLKIGDSSPSQIVQIAGQKAQRAVTLMLHAQLMNSKAKELLVQSQDMLKDAALN